jgi:hypothetical protein
MRRVKRFKKKQRSRFLGIFIKIILPLILLIIGILSFWFNTRYWNGKDKVAVVEQGSGGDVFVRIYDPVLSEVTTLVIPGETEVSVSRNLGTLRIKNVWQLGVNEKLEGKLLAQTVTKNFLFPVFLWRGEGLTNVPFGDRFLLWVFEKRAKNLQKSEINLGESQYIKRLKLSDGELGFKLVGDISERLTVYFSDNDFSQKAPGIYIKDKTGSFGVAENVGRVIEVLGGKVTTVEKAEPDDSDCIVSGDFSKKIARVFDCKVQKGSGKFDVEITLGKAFAKRF